MTQKTLVGLIFSFAILIILAFNVLFTVNERQIALILQFGEPKRIVSAPGLNAKIPFIQNLIYYDARVLSFNPPVEQMILADQKRLDVDSFVKYKIIDPLKFYQSVKTEEIFRQRLNPTLNAALRNVLGRVNLLDVLSQQRSTIMDEINTTVSEAMNRFGVKILDVRIKRADLPAETSQAIFKRMRSEREKEAEEFRAQGKEQAQEIKARAEKEAIVILSQASKKGKILQGEGDKSALKAIGRVAAQNSEFYSFFKSLEAYKGTLIDENTTFFLSPNNDFMKYFKNKNK